MRAPLTLATSAILATASLLGSCVASRGRETQATTCQALPSGFTEADIVGIWRAEYFGGLATDRLQIGSDGTYRQAYRSEAFQFTSDWHEWSLEYSPAGYAFLHLQGMRRCDDLDSICNRMEGGLPAGEQVVNQCTGQWMTYSDEVILLVTGSLGAPHGVELQHMRLAGSDWYYTFGLEQ